VGRGRRCYRISAFGPSLYISLDYSRIRGRLPDVLEFEGVEYTSPYKHLEVHSILYYEQLKRVSVLESRTCIVKSPVKTVLPLCVGDT
jgi:hypothetical protein